MFPTGISARGWMGPVMGAGGALLGGLTAGPGGALSGAAKFGAMGYSAGSMIEGPRAAGGITSGVDAGTFAREYYDTAFPGTNPWERLGTSQPGGQIAVAEKQAKQQAQNVKSQTDAQKTNAMLQATTSTSNTVLQTDTQKRLAEIKAGETAVQAGVASGSLDKVDRLRDFILTGNSGVTGRTEAQIDKGRMADSAQMQAMAAELNSWTKDFESKLRSKELDFKTGQAFGGPAEAALAAIATKAFQNGMLQKDFDILVRKHIGKFATGGAALHYASAASKIVANVFGQFRMKGAGAAGRGSPMQTSVSGKKRLPGDDKPMGAGQSKRVIKKLRKKGSKF